MPWKETDVMGLRLEFVMKALSEKVPFVELCREYGIAPKTGYKWKERFLRGGTPALSNRSRRPKHARAELSEAVVCEMIRLKTAHMHWGPYKIREVYARLHRGEKVPSDTSFKRVLDKAGLVKRRKKRRSKEVGRIENRMEAKEPNEVWTVDFKGWWRTSDGERCEPLTVRDAYSRYILCALVPQDAKTETIRRIFEGLFTLYGLPCCIRSDNGTPFACRQALLGLTVLSAWWLALGIDVDRIAPGCPSQNGAHERMHRDIACEVERHARGTLNHQMAALEVWRQTFNRQRPHESLGMGLPCEVYKRSERPYRGTPDRIEYPLGSLTRLVSKTGHIRFKSTLIFITSALRGWHVGLKPDGSNGFTVYFGRLCLGTLDPSIASFQPTPGALRRKE